jgi:ABC-type uncharacterized transport system auxiliary subunit
VRKWLVPLLLALTACAAPPVPEDRFYRLGDAPAAQAALPVLSARVGVATLKADGLHRERALLYSDDPDHRVLRQYHYHFWSDPPPGLISRHLSGFLNRNGVAAYVLDDIGVADADIDVRLEGRLLRFEQLLGGSGSRVSVEIAFVVVEAGEPEVLLSRRYQAETGVEGPGFAGVVRGFEAALLQIYRSLLHDLGTLSRGA